MIKRYHKPYEDFHSVDLLQEADGISDEDEIRFFLQAIVTADIDIDPLLCWSVSLKWFSSMEGLTQSILSAQLRSLYSESMNSWAENLIGDYHPRLYRTKIEPSLCAK